MPNTGGDSLRVTQNAAAQNTQVDFNWYSTLQFSLSALAILGLWCLAAVMGVLGLADLFQRGFDSNGLLSMLLMAGGLAACGLLLMPSAGYALARMLGKPLALKPNLNPWIQPSRLIFALPVVLLLGYLVSEINWVAWLVLPVLHVLAIGLPVLWFLYLGVRDLPLGSPQRSWGVFGSGLVLGPFLIMLAEFFALLLLMIGGMFYLTSRPELLEEITALSEWVITANPSVEMLVEKFTPFLLKPLFLLAVFSFIAVIVPLIEEAIKPVGVWLLAGRNLDAASGFAVGVLSGAGYALFESLMLTSAGEQWASLVVARIATAAIHILTTGIMGLALVQAWRYGWYIRLGVTYLAMVLIHGLWNGFTLFFVASSMHAEYFPEQTVPPLLQGLGALAPFILVAISLSAFVVLIWINRSLANELKNKQRFDLAEGRIPWG